MTTYFGILTKIGEAKEANAKALGVPVKIAEMEVGDGGGALPVPDREQTSLIGSKHRAPINRIFVDPSNPAWLVVEQVIPEQFGGWWARELGLRDADGDLIAVSNCPPTYKPQMAEGSARTQVVRMVLQVSSTSNFTLKIDPAVVLATRAYVDEKAIEVRVYADRELAKKLDKNGTAVAAEKIATPRRISLQGDVVGEATFDGTKDISVAAKVTQLNPDDWALGTFGARNKELLTVPGSGVWTVPAGVTRIRVRVVGGGAGFNGLHGGGGGGFAGGTFSVEPGERIPYVVGAGGLTGANGGSSSFGGLVSATGGVGIRGGRGYGPRIAPGGMGGTGAIFNTDAVGTGGGGAGSPYGPGGAGADYLPSSSQGVVHGRAGSSGGAGGGASSGTPQGTYGLPGGIGSSDQAALAVGMDGGDSVAGGGGGNGGGLAGKGQAAAANVRGSGGGWEGGQSTPASRGGNGGIAIEW